MPFGLTNTLRTVMILMNEVLKQFLSRFVIVYLDDILISNKKLEERLMRVIFVFEKLREEKLLINLNNCNFMKAELVYLGFIVSGEGINMDLEKVKDILEWPTHRSYT